MQAVHRHGERSALELAEALSASIATVRRDLAALERQGMIDRSWGGARVHVAMRYPDAFRRRAAHAARAKHALALAAAELVQPNMVVGLSGGTTCTVLARMLRGRPVNVVTNAVNVAAELFGSRPTKVILSGGALKANSFELVGAATDGVIRSYHYDLFFSSCSGSGDEGFTRRDHAEAAVVRSFMQVADRSVFLVDGSKLGREAPALVAPYRDVDELFVAGAVEPGWRRRLVEAGVPLVEVAEVPWAVPDASGVLQADLALSAPPSPSA